MRIENYWQLSDVTIVFESNKWIDLKLLETSGLDEDKKCTDFTLFQSSRLIEN